MRGLFQAGFVAACMQLMAIALETIVFFLAGGRDCPSEPTFSFLTWCYLLTALGIALTSNRFVTTTAARIRRASRLLDPKQPYLATETWLSYLCIASLGFGVIAFHSPPNFLVVACDFLGFACGASIAWSGMMSIGAASFGANARATKRAL